MGFHVAMGQNLAVVHLSPNGTIGFDPYLFDPLKVELSGDPSRFVTAQVTLPPPEERGPRVLFRQASLGECGCLCHLAVGQNQWHHFRVVHHPFLVYFNGDWDVHWGTGF